MEAGPGPRRSRSAADEAACIALDAYGLADGAPLGVLRVSAPGLDRAAVYSELAWMRAVGRAGLARTPRVLPTTCGAAVATIPGATLPWHAVLFESLAVAPFDTGGCPGA